MAGASAAAELLRRTSAQNARRERIFLREGWQLQSSQGVRGDGETFSSPLFTAHDWYGAAIPSTVLAALIDNGLYKDPYLGINLRSIPGCTYPIGAMFENLPMPEDSPFAQPWWYRTAFDVPQGFAGKKMWLHFGGINYRANLWINGKKVADASEFAGFWRAFEFDVTALVQPGPRNALALQVFAPQPDDLALTFVDWNPMPPDKCMGIHRDVYLSQSGPLRLRNAQVVTKFETPDLRSASLTIFANLTNAENRAIEGAIHARIGWIAISQRVAFDPRESKTITLSPESHPQLVLKDPKLWWPAPLGPQHLHRLHVSIETGGIVSDEQTATFGIREVTSELDDRDHRLFKVNGRPILIRGAAWTPDMMLRRSYARDRAQIDYVADMHLNAIRLEGKLPDDYFFDLCDRYGILVIAGWCCCDQWERWNEWTPENYRIAAESLRTQMRRFRNHPCMLTWLYGSDNAPPQDVEAMYRGVIAEERWPNPYLASAASRSTVGGGLTGVKMTGPYDYVAPAYWYEDTKHGGAFGFNTETSPGAAVPPLESLERMLPPDHLWPIDEYWNYHAAGGEFRSLARFTRAIEARYGRATSVEDYVAKAQLICYEGERAMFEAYRRNKYLSTGVVQWMLNNAWPEMFWHLFDYYLRPGGGYFGAKKANEPLHVLYSYDDRSVSIVNAYHRTFAAVIVRAAIYDLESVRRFHRERTIDVAADSSIRAFELPEIASLSTTYFLNLELLDASRKILSRNFYWLSARPDVFDWAASTWYMTPLREYADFSALASLQSAPPRVDRFTVNRYGDEERAHVVLHNPSDRISFFNRLMITKGTQGDEVLPILWEDNYLTLLPGERRTITARYRIKDLDGTQPAIKVSGGMGRT
jgi:exo-1,4-beta-D-glucosaminidase